MAVTVLKTPFVVLDEGDRIVGVGPDAESQFGPLVGSLIWDCFPGSAPLFKPYYEAARRSGEPVEFVQFYDGYVARIRAVPHRDGRLDLYWEQLARLDTLTLDGLARTLDSRSSCWTRSTSTPIATHSDSTSASSRVANELSGRRCSATCCAGCDLVLDDDDRITYVSSQLHDDFGPWIGHVLWERLPAAREVYRPAFDEARTSGRPVETVVFYSGRVKRLTVIPGPDGLAVHVERLAEVDVTSLATLTASLAQIEAALAGRASARRDSQARASLRALP